MSQDQLTPADSCEVQAPAAQRPAPESCLPDGKGLTLEQVRALIAQAHRKAISINDPILMVITMLNAYLGEVAALHGKHEKGLARLMAEKTDSYISGVQGATAQLSESLSSASVEGIKQIFHEHSSRLDSFRSNLQWLAAIVAVSALVNVAVFVLMGWR